MPIRAENRHRYPPDWREIRFAILSRADHRCECDGRCGGPKHASTGGRCTAEHGQPHPVTGSIVVLTVAHLDHTPEHCDPANLAAMCQCCHLSYDRDHHAETRRTTRAFGQDVLFGGDQ